MKDVANHLKMDKKRQICGSLRRGWSYRRIENGTGVRWETASLHPREWPIIAAKVPTGSESEPVTLEADAAIVPACLPEGRSAAHPYRSFIEAELEKGLSCQRIWKD